MADFTAIAAVTRTLRTLLLDRIATAGIAVTLAPPDVAVTGLNSARVNLYLYQVLEHAQLKNQTIPGRGDPATYGGPPLSLTLRYLLTSHARSEDQPDSDLIAQAILGDAMIVLHELGGRMDDLRLVTNRAGAIGDPVLDVVLRQEFERAKLVLHPVVLEDLSRLWSAMPQASFRRSVVYEASLVQIETRTPRRPAPPVETRRILIGVARPPALQTAYRTPGPPPANQFVREGRVAIGDRVTFEHPRTTADRLYVRFGGLEPIRVPLPSSGLIVLALPDDTYPIDLDHPATRPIPTSAQLQPGPLEVLLVGVEEMEGVEGGLDRGQPVTEPRQLRSNSVVLQLTPRIITAIRTGAGPGEVLRITGTRLWAPTLPSAVIVGDLAVPLRPPEPGETWAAPSPTLVEVPVAAIAAVLPPTGAGDPPYPVAVQVNGARSRETTFTFTL